MLVYKHKGKIEYVKNLPNFKEKHKLCRYITRDLLGLRMQNFQGMIIK